MLIFRIRISRNQQRLIAVRRRRRLRILNEPSKRTYLRRPQMADESNNSQLEDLTTKKLRDLNSGLCATCTHVRLVESAKGSAFVLCTLSNTDARFPKYPRLPVLACGGYEARR